MNPNSEESSSRPCWFVGASYNKVEDQTDRFLQEGKWENGFDEDHPTVAMTKTMQPGDRIAIKSNYVRKHDLPFDNRNQFVAVLAIKARGKITENPGDGHTVKVDWQKIDPVREWYFYTFRGTIWRVTPREYWHNDALIAFTFDDMPQEMDRFRNAPYWRDRFGDVVTDRKRYEWTHFYEAFADKLMGFKDKRSELIDGIQEIASRVDGMSLLKGDRFSDGTTGPLKDICPFTTIGLFNHDIAKSKRQDIGTELAKFLNINEPPPASLDGIPVLNNQSSWLFGFENDRKSDDIDSLWEAFLASDRTHRYR